MLQRLLFEFKCRSTKTIARMIRISGQPKVEIELVQLNLLPISCMFLLRFEDPEATQLRISIFNEL